MAFDVLVVSSSTERAAVIFLAVEYVIDIYLCTVASDGLQELSVLVLLAIGLMTFAL